MTQLIGTGQRQVPTNIRPGQFVPDANAFRIPGYSSDRNEARSLLSDAVNFSPRLDLSGQASVRNDQSSLARLLQQRAAGQSSATAEMLRQAGDRAAMQAQGAAMAGSAYNPGLALRLGLQGANQAQGQAAEQARVGALQEQAQAQGLAAQLLSGMRGQDLSAAGLQADTDIKARQLRQQQQQSMLDALMRLDIAQGGLAASGQQLTGQAYMAQQEQDWRQQQMDFNREQRWWDLGGKVLGGLAGGAGAALTGIPWGSIGGGATPPAEEFRL